MEQPQIQYARTSDGVSIAYMTVGDGAPVLLCLSTLNSMGYDLNDSGPPTFSHALRAHTRLTAFDHAGIGASQRDVSDFSHDAQLRAIEAVVALLDDDQFTVVGAGTGCASAALYATRHPERVRELACVFPANSSFTEGFAAEMRHNWSYARRRMASGIYPDGPVSRQRLFSNAMRDSMTSEVAAAYMDEFARADLTAIYRRIPVPTLICVPPTGPTREPSLALASLVPDCRVSVIPPHGVGRATAVLKFMGIEAAQVDPSLDGEASTPPPPAAASGMKAILFTDIADSTALTERMGDAAFREASRALDEGIRAAIRDAGGTPVEGKVLGDGVMGVFTSAADGISAARACAALAGDLRLHIGLHAGDAIDEGGNVYGGAVNIAARVCALSAPGGILVSSTMRELARTSTDASFEDYGEHQLKGIEDAVRVFAVREQE